MVYCNGLSHDDKNGTDGPVLWIHQQHIPGQGKKEMERKCERHIDTHVEGTMYPIRFLLTTNALPPIFGN